MNETQEQITTPETATTGGQWPGAFAAIGQAFEQIKKNPQPALIIIGTYIVLNIISTVVYGKPAYSLNAGSSSNDGAYLPEITWLIFALALPVYGLAVADKRVISVAEFLKFDLRKFLFVIVASILAAIIIIFSALLILIPLIWTVAWFAAVEFPVAEKGMSPVDALKESKRLTSNHKAKVWGIIGATMLLAIPAVILSLIPFVGVVALVFLQVLSSAAIAILYRWLQHTQPSA